MRRLSYDAARERRSDIPKELRRMPFLAAWTRPARTVSPRLFCAKPATEDRAGAEGDFRWRAFYAAVSGKIVLGGNRCGDRVSQDAAVTRQARLLQCGLKSRGRRRPREKGTIFLSKAICYETLLDIDSLRNLWWRSLMLCVFAVAESRLASREPQSLERIMKSRGFRLIATVAAFSSAAWIAYAQQKPVYLDPSLPPEQRAADLVRQMTLEEKATQLVNQARAIPRLNVPAYDWWSESLHGVAVNGTTEFPEPIGLAATFDPKNIHEMAVAISTEGRIKHVQAVRAGHSNIFEGLDFWAPNINIFRDPRWGRGQETYGEDPFLTARMGVAFVTGMQGDDPKYYRVISTPKHFAVHSGPEPTRHEADVKVSKHDEVDTYLPAFRATVTEAKAGSVMCAYNSINGQPACANEFLLDDQLRGKWGFHGYVVSDCGAVTDIFNGHHYRPTQAQSSAISLTRGMDNECADFFSKVNDDHDYKPYVDAVRQGYLAESDVDKALVRLFTARMKLGMFDPPEMVPYSKIDEKELDSAAHRALALKLANESMVLLKNDGTLPLKTSGIKIAVIGPLANQTRVLLGNYNGSPTHTVSILEGLHKEFADDSIQYVPGTQFLS